MMPFPLYPVGRVPHVDGPSGPRERAAVPPVVDDGYGLGEGGENALEDLREALRRLRDLVRMLEQDPSQDPVVMESLQRHVLLLANFITLVEGERPPTIIPQPEVSG